MYLVVVPTNVEWQYCWVWWIEYTERTTGRGHGGWVPSGEGAGFISCVSLRAIFVCCCGTHGSVKGHFLEHTWKLTSNKYNSTSFSHSSTQHCKWLRLKTDLLSFIKEGNPSDFCSLNIIVHKLLVKHVKNWWKHHRESKLLVVCAQ